MLIFSQTNVLFTNQRLLAWRARQHTRSAVIIKSDSARSRAQLSYHFKEINNEYFICTTNTETIQSLRIDK